MKSNNNWFIKLKLNDNICTLYDNGLLYGKEKGHKIGLLNDKSLNDIKTLINSNIYMFKTLEYYNAKENNLVLKINDNSRKKRNIKIVGWHYSITILNILKNQNNYIKLF